MAHDTDTTRPTEQQRREHGRVMLHAALAAIDARERAARADYDHARRMFAQVEAWLGGAPEPEMFGAWRTIHRDLFDGDLESSEAAAASDIYRQQFMASTQFVDAMISSVLDGATGIDNRIARDMEILRDEMLMGINGLEDHVERLFDAACPEP